MIKQYVTQAWAQLRQQPLISAVSIAGTALAISFTLIALMIAIGIGIPARKAMKVQPAEALHDE